MSVVSRPSPGTWPLVGASARGWPTGNRPSAPHSRPLRRASKGALVADPIRVSVPFRDRQDALLRDRQARPPEPGRRRRLDRRHHRADHGQRRPRRPSRHRLLPADRRRRGAGLRRRQDPRLVLPPGGPSRPRTPFSPAASPTARCARRSPTGFRNETQVVHRPSSVPTGRTPTTCCRSTPPRPP